MDAITLEDVFLRYRVEFKEGGRMVTETLAALKSITLRIGPGETVGIIGENGAGKTSLLKVIAGILNADAGRVRVCGRVASLMDIGSGFQKDLPGSENIYLLSCLLGLSKDETDARYHAITEFAALGRFIHAPLKHYSQGMSMRLGFAIAIHADPDILLIDDTFAVGDTYTQRKCMNKIFELKNRGTTIVFVTHDLEMAKRVCSRGVFLRCGEIVKDGSMQKVIGYYAETVGNKRGIAILQKGSLGLVFNNGRLVLRWKDATLTVDLSGHGGMLFSGREYLSTTAEWRVSKLARAYGFIAVGRWPDMPVVQYWKLVFLNDKEFLWEIEIQAKGEKFPEKCETRTIFADRYTNWLSITGEKRFPDSFIHTEQWQCSPVEGNINAVVGLRGDQETDGFLPSVIFDRSKDNLRTACYLGNTGAEIHGRVLQYVTFPQKPANGSCPKRQRCFRGRVKIFAPEEQEALQAYLGSMRQRIEEAKAIGVGVLSIVRNGNRLEIYWKDRLLTQGAGLNTQFRYQGKDYRAIDGVWDVRKDSEDELKVIISWNENQAFKQIWRLRLKGDGIIVWEIAMEIEGAARIKNKQTEMLLSAGYERWIAAEESGDFKRLDKNGTVTLNKYANMSVGLEGSRKTGGNVLPRILFDCHDTTPRVTYIFKDQNEGRAARLQYLEIDSREDCHTSSARYEYFKGSISVFDLPEAKKSIETIQPAHLLLKRAERGLNSIESKRLALIFDYGKGRIFWDGKELTKGFGLYSSVFLRDRWQDSPQAFWEVNRVDKNSLKAVGRWPWAPLIQTWEVSISDENMITWKIRQETWEEVALEKEQVNLMISDIYKEWFSDKQTHGVFPERFRMYNGLCWDRLWRADARVPVGLKGPRIKHGFLNRESLPTIMFECGTGCPARYAVIENTDHIFQARVLQYELESGRNINVGSRQDKYFEGRISISG